MAFGGNGGKEDIPVARLLRHISPNKLYLFIHSSISYTSQISLFPSLWPFTSPFPTPSKNKNETRTITHSTKFPSGSRQYTLLSFPLAPVRSTTPSSVFSVPRSTICTPFEISRSRTLATGSEVRKHRSALPSFTFWALGSNSWVH